MAASPYDPMDPGVRRDPYPCYRELRRSAPVALVESTGFYTVARHRDVLEVLRNPEVFSSRAMRYTATNGRPQSALLAAAGSPPPEAVAKLFASLPFPPAELAVARNLIATDGPGHNDLRAIVNRGFTPRRIAELEPRIRAIARDCLAEARRKGELDLVADLAIPLPVTVIAELLGVDPERRPDFKRWSDTIVATAAGGAMPGVPNPGTVTVFAELISYLASVIEDRRRAPREDLVSILVRAEDGAAALKPAEVVTFALLILVAGNETTTNLLGNALLALTEHPAALERVQRERALVPALIEEVLRYDAPVQLVMREVTRDVELGGVALAEGSIVAPLLGSANRDDDAFPNADRFALDRERAAHVGFGNGVHFCLGAALARLEARVALEELFELPALSRKPTGEIVRVDSFMLRGLRSLPLACAI
jgi:cytochrome P450